MSYRLDRARARHRDFLPKVPVGAKPKHAGLPVLVDTREQTPFQFTEGVLVERATLPTGDYSIKGFTDRVAIERKALADLVACCGPERERFLAEMDRMRAYELRLLVVEASLDDVLTHAYRSEMNPQSVVGTTIALLADYGVPTLWGVDARTASNYLERLFFRIWSKSQERAA